MKSTIKLEEIGTGIRTISKTKDGIVHIEVGRGDGNAKKLEQVIKTSLGEEGITKTQVEKFFVDIRDIEETTSEAEIVDGILEGTNDIGAEKIKVRNSRNFYGGKKQALGLNSDSMKM